MKIKKKPKFFPFQQMRRLRVVEWGTKLGMIKCRTTDIPEYQNYEY